MPKVWNKRDPNCPKENAVYVGRPSKWQNPYKIGVDGTREHVIRLYRRALVASRVDLNELKGKDLVCWCAPLPCHADILLEFANDEEKRLDKFEEVLKVLKRHIDLHSVRYGGAVFSITSFEEMAREICQVFELKHLGKAEFKTAFADELLDQMTGDEK